MAHGMAWHTGWCGTSRDGMRGFTSRPRLTRLVIVVKGVGCTATEPVAVSMEAR